MNVFNHCFEKHSFGELNNIDVSLFQRVLYFCTQNSNINPNGQFFDIGSNAGSFVKIAAGYNFTNMHCFEPHPVISKKTKTVYPHIIMNDYCLGNNDGTIDIHIPDHSVGLSSIIDRPVFKLLGQNIHKLNVKMEKLDTYCETNNISEIEFIKIDVEGSEKMIFEGASKMLSSNKIKSGLFEIGQTLYDANTSENEIVSLLEQYGYKVNKTLDTNNYIFYLPR
jgi:FkbM family methyltransferase